MGFSLKKLMKSDIVKVGAGVAAGYALSKYAPQLQQTATNVRKAVQEKKKSLFPNYGKSADQPAAKKIPPGAPGAGQPDPGDENSGSLLDHIIKWFKFMFGRG